VKEIELALPPLFITFGIRNHTGEKELKENTRPPLFIYSTTPYVQDGQLGILHS
jgi:hypothetical protein